VLAYFTALQQNLEYDVQKWKKRAHHWQQLYEQSEKKKKKKEEEEEGQKLEAKKKKKHQEEIAEKKDREEKNNKKEVLKPPVRSVEVHHRSNHHHNNDDEHSETEKISETQPPTKKTTKQKSPIQKQTNTTSSKKKIHSTNETKKDDCILPPDDDDASSSSLSASVVEKTPRLLTLPPSITIDQQQQQQEKEKEKERQHDDKDVEIPDSMFNFSDDSSSESEEESEGGNNDELDEDVKAALGDDLAHVHLSSSSSEDEEEEDEDEEEESIKPIQATEKKKTNDNEEDSLEDLYSDSTPPPPKRRQQVDRKKKQKHKPNISLDTPKHALSNNNHVIARPKSSQPPPLLPPTKLKLSPYQQFKIQQIRKSYFYLLQLGVNVVTINTTTTTTTTTQCMEDDDEDDDNDNSSEEEVEEKEEKLMTVTTTINVLRKSEEDVVMELMSCLKSIVKLSFHRRRQDDASSLPKQKYYGPFILVNCNNHDNDDNNDDDGRRITNKKQFLPCCYDCDTEVNLPEEENGETATKGLLYCQHPAAKALEYTVQALHIMDLHCGQVRDGGTDGDWDDLSFDPPSSSSSYWKQKTDISHDNDNCIVTSNDTNDDKEETKEHQRQKESDVIKTGMRNRRKLTQIITSSLEGEIVSAWTWFDRSTRIASPALFFDATCVDEPSSDDDDDHDEGGDPQNNNTTAGRFVPPYGPKSHTKLVSLSERIVHARIVSSLYQLRNDIQKAGTLVLRYVLESAPSLGSGVEDYPRLPPVLSLCVLEALLLPPMINMNEEQRRQWTLLFQGDTSEESTIASSSVSSSVSWFYCFLRRLSRHSTELGNNDGDGYQTNSTISSSSLLLERTLSLTIHKTAEIWRERRKCSHDRIKVASTVELDAYERIMRLEGTWMMDSRKQEGWNALEADACCSSEESAKIIIQEALTSLLPASLYQKIVALNKDRDGENLFNDNGKSNVHAQCRHGQKTSETSAALSLQLALILLGDAKYAAEVFQLIVDTIMLSTSANGLDKSCSSSAISAALVASCRAYRSIRRYRWDSVPLEGRRNGPVSSELIQLDQIYAHLDNVMGWLSRPNKHQKDQNLDILRWEVISAIARCSVTLADGHLAFRIGSWFASPRISSGSNDEYRHGIEEGKSLTMPRTISTMSRDDKQRIAMVMSTIVDVCEHPTVRVINLKRRPDRLLNFLAQAQREQLLVVRAIPKLGLSEEDESPLSSISDEDQDFVNKETDLCWGEYAFDGAGNECTSMLVFDERMAERLGSYPHISAFVGIKWRPNDLKAFDTEARNDTALVPMSTSERACALSHISSWKGVERSLLFEKPLLSSNPCVSFQDQDNLKRLFKVSGFARGNALKIENEGMPPTPVCVILEDDAVLADRFTDRLSNLLEELPRDFHFCSLGYSRPRTAPMVQYSPLLGVPSCLWYLTGYVLSLEGARHLLKSLPVKGPVDSWIGLKMCANWDNVFGQTIGVGTHPKVHPATPARKDLAQIMNFRAFAALVPLCSQKVGGTMTESSNRKSGWRNRDTDVTYSGNVRI